MNRFAQIAIALGFWTLGLGPALAWSHPAPVWQQADQQELTIRVLLVQSNEVTIDLGSQSRVQLGDRVIFEPLGHPSIDGVVTRVSEREAVVTVTGTTAQLRAGVPGRVWATGRAVADPIDPPEPGGAPDGIVWAEDPEIWQEGMPLLGNIGVARPEERPADWSGRVEVGGRLFEDQSASGRKDRQLYVRTGLRGSNPFGYGGDLNLQVDWQSTNLDVDGASVGLVDDSDSYLRIQQASYAVGGTRFEGRRLEVGRFYSRAFPELGILDGVEYSQALSSGSRVGASVGFQPGFEVELPFRDDLAISAFWERRMGERNRSSVGAAVQSTWFDGSSDRQWGLFKGHFEVSDWVLDGALEADWYDDEPIPPTSGLEWTHSRLRLERKIKKDAAFGVYTSDVRWPNTQRGLPVLSDPQFLVSARTQRTGVDGWWALNDTQRLHGQYERWSDEDSDGSLGELGIDGRFDPNGKATWLVQFYWSETDFTDIQAVRLGAATQTGAGRWEGNLELGRFELFDTNGATIADSQGVLRGGWSGAAGGGWRAFVQAASFFGGDQDAYSLAFSLSRSF